MPLLILTAITLFVALALAAYWLVVVTEGAYLGPAAVVRLYDRGADTYDDVKGFDRLEEFLFLGRPLIDRLEATTGADATLLDLATGTGRLPATLLDMPYFEGRLLACDASWGMLQQASEKLSAYGDRIQLLQLAAEPLPFTTGSFGAVTMLEALEFLPDRQAALREAIRVLAPGGWVLTTNRIGIEAQLMPGRTDSPTDFEARLAALGLVDCRTAPWQSYYDLVWGRKPGDPSRYNPPAPWYEILVCPNCGLVGSWFAAGSELSCSRCGALWARSNRIWRFG